MIDSSEEATMFLNEIRKEKPRYFRDQLSLIKKAVDGVGVEIVKNALTYCLERNLYSATLFKETIEFLKLKEEEKKFKDKQKTNPIPEKFKSIKPQVRSIEEYTNIVGG